MPCLGVNFLFSLKNASTDAVVAGHGDPICHTLYLSSDEKLDASDTPLGYEFRFEDVAPGAEYSMSASVILPLVPEGHYFVLLQPDCHPDPAADNVRSVALEIGGDPTVRVTRLEELHAQHAMGDSEYERQRSELTQWFANCATPSPMGARWH